MNLAWQTWSRAPTRMESSPHATLQLISDVPCLIIKGLSANTGFQHVRRYNTAAKLSCEVGLWEVGHRRSLERIVVPLSKGFRLGGWLYARIRLCSPCVSATLASRHSLLLSLPSPKQLRLVRALWHVEVSHQTVLHGSGKASSWIFCLHEFAPASSLGMSPRFKMFFHLPLFASEGDEVSKPREAHREAKRCDVRCEHIGFGRAALEAAVASRPWAKSCSCCRCRLTFCEWAT